MSACVGRRGFLKDGLAALGFLAHMDTSPSSKGDGIRPERAVKYKADARGTELLYETVCETVSSVRCARKVNDDWSKKIAEDTKKRGE